VESRDGRIRVLVADDSPTALRSVCRYLKFEGAFQIVGTARDGQHALHQAQRFRPDLILIDLSMPLKNGLEAAMELRKAYPEIRVLIYSQFKRTRTAGRVLTVGGPRLCGKKAKCRKTLMEEVHRLFPDKSQKD